MKRELNCKQCADRWWNSGRKAPGAVVKTLRPGVRQVRDPRNNEAVRQVLGTLLVEGLVCDGCATPLEQGGEAVCTSVFTPERGHFDWEHDYLRTCDNA